MTIHDCLGKAAPDRLDQVARPSARHPGGVAITISSARNSKSASAIACSGTASPTCPSASIPAAQSLSRLTARRRPALARASSSSDSQFRRRELSAGAITRTSARCSLPSGSPVALRSAFTSTVSFATTRILLVAGV
jgi:hypothetical protein